MLEIEVAKSIDLLNGKMLSVTAGAKRVVLFRTMEGALSALDDRCSHAEVRLSSGIFEGGEVTCPAHGARFDVCTGKHLCMPAVTGVRAYKVLERDGSVIIQMP